MVRGSKANPSRNILSRVIISETATRRFPGDHVRLGIAFLTELSAAGQISLGSEEGLDSPRFRERCNGSALKFSEFVRV